MHSDYASKYFQLLLWMVKLFGKSYGGIYNYIMHFVKHQCTWHVFILKCSCCKIRKHLEWQVNINVIHNDVLYNFYKHKQKHKQFLLLLMRYFYVHYRCGNSIICIAIIVYIIYVFNLSSINVYAAIICIWDSYMARLIVNCGM